MKSLLTQEMSMQHGTKRRSPSIIARLMGLDGLPPQSSSHKQAKSVDNQQCRPITSEKACGKKTYGGDLRRGGSMDEQKFKDVFEVLDSEKEKSNNRCLYQRRVDANLSEAEMAFIRHKFMEAKLLSADEKLQYSKEFSETLGALDSNKDILLNFIQHPDSLFTNHLPGVQSRDPKPHSSQATTLKLSNSPNHVENFETLKMDRELLGKRHKSPQWHGGGANLSHSNTRCDDTIGLSSKKQLKLTEIVVLKPNLGKPQTTSRDLSSQSSSCDEIRAYRRFPCTRKQESKAFGSLKANEDSRAIARIVSRQMKASCGSDNHMNFEISRFRGYAGDESSSGSDSSSESKLVSVISRARTEYNRKNHHPSLPFRASESSASKEAMQRLSDRWNLSYKSEQEIQIRRSNTLAEMLATSDREVRKASHDGKEGLSNRFESNVGQSELLEPIGISSRCGWRSTDKKDLSKSRTIMDQDRTCGYTIVLPKKLTTRDGLVKRSSSYNRELFLSNNCMPVSSSSHLSYSSSSEINRPSSSKVPYMDGELSNEKLPSLKAKSSLTVHADSDTDNGSDSEEGKTTLSLEPPDLSAVTSLTNLDISGMPTEEVDPSSIPQLHSLESAKEGDQPSPVSILPTSFHGTEFSSSSECFESLSADLQGLRMQLQLLRIESATHNKFVPSNEEADQEESSIVTNETLIIQEPGEDWKSLYLADVLAKSSFNGLNPKSFMTTWYSSESPVDPSLFEDLEKKYSCLKTSTRLERKCLFDRINSEILDIFEQLTDLQPTKVCPKWDIERIQETLGELVTEKYMKPSRDTKEKELQWLNLKDDIDEVMGKEIEEMLIDEVIGELVIREIS
ncbi:hypothetical protein V5N11_020538 [Cardamine amara subsp. amara]|uniref:DUF4378 domain-containing protein n=1 Tax=Cardamine amara subsp. amara TaxID=228776 RepID=A0ABD1ATM8_CARAN